MPRKIGKSKATCHPDRDLAGKGLCRSCYASKHERENRTHRNNTKRDWTSVNPDKVRVVKIKQMYGLSLIELEEMRKRQKGKCMICRNNMYGKNEHIDHDHVTKKVRGLLCNTCNAGLGFFKEDLVNLYRAIEYLKLFGTISKKKIS